MSAHFVDEGMRAVLSEKVTWESCPRCKGPVALGWVGHTVTEIDCAAACELTDSHRESVQRSATPPV